MSLGDAMNDLHAQALALRGTLTAEELGLLRLAADSAYFRGRDAMGEKLERAGLLTGDAAVLVGGPRSRWVTPLCRAVLAPDVAARDQSKHAGGCAESRCPESTCSDSCWCRSHWREGACAECEEDASRAPSPTGPGPAVGDTVHLLGVHGDDWVVTRTDEPGFVSVHALGRLPLRTAVDCVCIVKPADRPTTEVLDGDIREDGNGHQWRVGLRKFDGGNLGFVCVESIDTGGGGRSRVPPVGEVAGWRLVSRAAAQREAPHPLDALRALRDAAERIAKRPRNIDVDAISRSYNDGLCSGRWDMAREMLAIAEKAFATVERELAEARRREQEARDHLEASQSARHRLSTNWAEARAQGEAARAALRALVEAAQYAPEYMNPPSAEALNEALGAARARLSASAASGDGAAAEGSEGK
jgi:hypothetical protein